MYPDMHRVPANLPEVEEYVDLVRQARIILDMPPMQPTKRVWASDRYPDRWYGDVATCFAYGTPPKYALSFEEHYPAQRGITDGLKLCYGDTPSDLCKRREYVKALYNIHGFFAASARIDGSDETIESTDRRHGDEARFTDPGASRAGSENTLTQVNGNSSPPILTPDSPAAEPPNTGITLEPQNPSHTATAEGLGIQSVMARKRKAAAAAVDSPLNNGTKRTKTGVDESSSSANAPISTEADQNWFERGAFKTALEDINRRAGRMRRAFKARTEIRKLKKEFTDTVWPSICGGLPTQWSGLGHKAKGEKTEETLAAEEHAEPKEAGEREGPEVGSNGEAPNESEKADEGEEVEEIMGGMPLE
jgi:hypothetical protein